MNIAELKQRFIDAREAYRAALQAELNTLAEAPKSAIGKPPTVRKKKGPDAPAIRSSHEDILQHIPKDRASALNFWSIAKASGIKPKQANVLLKKLVSSGQAVKVANGPATKYHRA
jgi:hypothetical protein